MLLGSPRRTGCLLTHALQGLCAGLVAAVSLHFAVILGGSNFRTVLPGQAFRSGQMSADRLGAAIDRHGIRTVVNLRGACVGAPWYQQQVAVTADRGIAQEDISFSATRMPSTESVRDLIAVLDRSEYPILIHCAQGADRTGLASVVVMLLRTDAPPDVALSQLSPAYGHVPLGRTAFVGRFFALYRDWLADTGKEHSPDAFRHWATRLYCPDRGRAKFELLAAESARLRIPASRARAVTIRCRNTSLGTWHFEPGATAGFHGQWSLLDRDDTILGRGRTGLRRATVAPGESIDLDVPLPPLAPGTYSLYFDLTEEQHASFMQLGNEMLAVAVEVTP